MQLVLPALLLCIVCTATAPRTVQTREALQPRTMSEGVAAPVAEVENVPTDGPMDINTGVRMVLKKALQHDGLARGLHEGARAIEKGQAQLCILAEDTDSPDYKKLIEALCAEQNVNLISVPTKLQLGEMAGLCRIDAEGKAQKVVACSCAVVTDYGEESQGLNVLREYLKGR